MARPKEQSALYRLIEAGQLVRQALLVPLAARGLEPGDDAVLFLLRDPLGAGEQEIASALGVAAEALRGRLRRLEARGLIAHRAAAESPLPGFVLTAEGERLRDLLGDNWDRLEADLLGELPRKRRRSFRKDLARVVERLRL